MDKQREAEVVERCRQGDRGALGQLIDEYHRPIFNAAFRMLGTTEGAADVTQAAFLKVIENIKQYDDRYRFFSWLYRIAMNEAIDTLKRDSRFEAMPVDIESSDARPPALAEQAQASSRLQTALMQLNEEQRAVVVLRYFTDLSYDDIGSVLQIPNKTVKSRLFAARQCLRRRLEESGVLSS